MGIKVSTTIMHFLGTYYVSDIECFMYFASVILVTVLQSEYFFHSVNKPEKGHVYCGWVLRTKSRWMSPLPQVHVMKASSTQWSDHVTNMTQP